MKRDPSLARLSRDHHQALFRAMRLRRVTADDAADVRDDVLAFFNEHGLRHFEVEEQVLLPGCAHRLPDDHPDVERILVDHTWMRERLHRLERGELELAKMRELGARLDAHVRHEERVLFPAIEGALTDSELLELGRRIEAAERA